LAGGACFIKYTSSLSITHKHTTTNTNTQSGVVCTSYMDSQEYTLTPVWYIAVSALIAFSGQSGEYIIESALGSDD